MADVHFSAHAAAILPLRGTNFEEVTQAINGSGWYAAGRGRLDCRKDFEYGADWNGKHYAWKQVRPLFIEDPAGVKVLTVYTYFMNETAP